MQIDITASVKKRNKTSVYFKSNLIACLYINTGFLFKVILAYFTCVHTSALYN